jgi:hypothetical protein
LLNYIWEHITVVLLFVYRFFGVDVLGDIRVRYRDIQHCDIFHKIQSKIADHHIAFDILFSISDMWYCSFGSTWGVYKKHAVFE